METCISLRGFAARNGETVGAIDAPYFLKQTTPLTILVFIFIVITNIEVINYSCCARAVPKDVGTWISIFSSRNGKRVSARCL